MGITHRVICHCLLLLFFTSFLHFSLITLLTRLSRASRCKVAGMRCPAFWTERVLVWHGCETSQKNSGQHLCLK